MYSRMDSSTLSRSPTLVTSWWLELVKSTDLVDGGGTKLPRTLWLLFRYRNNLKLLYLPDIIFNSVTEACKITNSHNIGVVENVKQD